MLRAILILSIFKSVLCVELSFTFFSGEVSEKNFSYFNVTIEGTLKLELHSLTGDCDLYVSQYTLTPTYEPHMNSLQSATCGLDTVIIPKSFRRPLGIGVFGHSSHELCSFYLSYYVVDDSLDTLNYNPYSDLVNFYDKKLHISEDGSNESSNDKSDDASSQGYFIWISKVVLNFMMQVMVELIIDSRLITIIF